MAYKSLVTILGALALTACTNTGGDDDTDATDSGMDTEMMESGDSGDTGEPMVDYPEVVDGITYRALDTHPGCSTAGLSYTAATIAGFDCAAKEYAGTEDTTKPIVLLIHGNSDTPTSWESYSTGGACGETGATEDTDMLAEQLADAGYKTLALDMRYDLVDDPAGNNDTENAAKNMDHGWGTPIAQHFIESVATAYPDRQISIIGFSFGVTVARDAVRRLALNDEMDILPRIDDMVMLAGANHGVSTFYQCALNETMRGTVTCEMGDRAAYTPTDFLIPLNGPEGAWETPCADGMTAWERPICGDHTVDWTTIVMEDLEGGEQQDLFVSEASSALMGADNVTLGLNDFDESNYFYCGLFKNHYGAARSTEALSTIMARLAD